MKPEILEYLRPRFWARVAVGGPNECWMWSGNRNLRTGYGRIVYRDKWIQAHRIAWMLNAGPVPEGYYVCHHCDNPACVNLRHLFVGTSSDNRQDAKRKGRLPDLRGEKNTKARLTEAQVRKLRADAASGADLHQLAYGLGITHGTAYNIVKRYKWPHVA